MNDDLFEGCWQRLERAAEHRSAGMTIWNEYLEPHPFDYEVVNNGDSTFIVRVVQESPLPAGLGIEIGGWLYSLRAALDNIIWATAAHVAGAVPPPNEHVLQNPIYDSEDAWTRNLYRLKGLAEHHRTMLLTMQPWNSDLDANFLGWINRLARDDRHRRPVAMTSYLADMRPVVGVPEGIEAALQFGDRIIEGSADCIRLTVPGWVPGMTVKINPRMGIDPEILSWSKSPFWSQWDFNKRLKTMESFVAGEVAVYEYDCVGTSRRQEMLTKGYKAECDARVRGSAPVAASRSSTSWTDAKFGTPASEETMREVGDPRGPLPFI